MLRTTPLTDRETKDLVELSLASFQRAKIRIFLMTSIGAVLTLIYPNWLILVWYFPMITLDFFNLRIEKNIIHAKQKEIRLNHRNRAHYFVVSWAESLCLVAFFIGLSVYEGQISHFVPYLILLVASIYTAMSTFQNAVLMFGHLTFYNLAMIYVSVRDVILTLPDTGSLIWTQFFCSMLIVLFLTDSYLFFNKMHLERNAKAREIDEARKHAEKLTRQKSDLISAIGHELRTPLNGILGFSNVMKRTKLTKKQQEYVDLIEGAGKDLQLLLSDILDSETLEQGQFHLRPTMADVSCLLSRTMKIFETAAAAKGIDLKLEIDDGFPDEILIDETRLGQCVSNLLSNAIRFTDIGGITVKASFTNDDQPKFTIRVIDTGIGIPESQTDRIFEKFGQGEHQKISHGGTGLGLWLVQSIAQAMDGALTLHRTSAKGSEFRLEFPINTQISISKTDIGGLADKRVLHIEDTETNLMLIRVLLEEHGMDITEARTGRHAIKMLKSSEFDMVICDLQLPDCDGNQVLTDIRKLEGPNTHIPVIALTAQPEKVSGGKSESGFFAILSKPLNQQMLISTLLKL